MRDKTHHALEDAFGKAKTMPAGAVRNWSPARGETPAGESLYWEIHEGGVRVEVLLPPCPPGVPCSVEVTAADDPLRSLRRTVRIESNLDIRELVAALRRGDFGRPNPAPDAANGYEEP